MFKKVPKNDENVSVSGNRSAQKKSRRKQDLHSNSETYQPHNKPIPIACYPNNENFAIQQSALAVANMNVANSVSCANGLTFQNPMMVQNAMG